MGSTQNFELVGGIARAVIYPTTALLPSEIGQGGEFVEIEPKGSFYRESAEMREGQRVVIHHLELLTPQGSLPLSDEQLERGVIVDLLLQSGKRLRLGWSERFGAQLPMMFLRSESKSGERRLDYPEKRWFFESLDLTNLL